MRLTELVEAIDFLRKAGWTVEPPGKHRTLGSPIVKEPRRKGRPPKNGRRKRGRPRKSEQV